MKKTLLNKLSLLLVVMLVAATAFGCGNKTTEKNETPAQTQVETEAAEVGVTVLGDEAAKYAFNLTVVDQDEVTTVYEVHTDKENVGDALVELGVIDDASFFSSVNGMVADWNADQAYWAVYVGEEYASVGVGEMTFTEGEQMDLSFVYTVSQ